MLTAAPPRYDFTIIGPNVHVPFRPSPAFRGRQRDLVDLYRLMIGNLNKIGLNHVGTVGMGGIGKTQLAVEFVHRFSFAFDSVFWIDATSSDKWLDQFVEIAKSGLGLKAAEAASGIEVTQLYMSALEEYCRSHPQMLIIMDNVQDPLLLNRAAPLLGVAVLSLRCNVLFTTRSHFQIEGVAEHPVDILSREAAVALLASMRSQVGAAEQASAALICQAVGNLPLALVLVGSFLRNKPRVSYAAYYEGLQQRGLPAIELKDLPPEALATRHKGVVSDVLREQLALVNNKNSLLIFKLAGLFPENAIVPKARLGLFAGLEDTTVFDQPLDDACILLEQLSLIEPAENGAAIRLHPLVRDFSWRLVGDSERKAFLSGALNRVANAYTLKRLEREYQSRGIDAVIEDLDLASSCADEDTPDRRAVMLLSRMLDRERHHLREGGAIMQQLHYRAVDMGLEQIAGSFAEAARKPMFRVKRISWHEDRGLIRTMEGHTRGITSVALSSDGRRAITGSADATLIMWDLTTGAALRRFAGHHVELADTYVTLVNDDQRALSAQDRLLILWDLNTGGVYGHWELPSASVPLRHPTGWKSKEILEQLTAARISGIAVRRDGRFAVVGYGNDVLVIEVDLAKGTQNLIPFQFHKQPVTAVCLYPDDRHVLSASEDTTLVFWDLEEGKCQPLEGHKHPVIALSISADGNRALSASDNGDLHLWDMQRGTVLRQFETEGARCQTVCLSADGKKALSATYSHSVWVWDADTGRVLRRFDEHSETVGALCFAPNGRFVLSGSRQLMLWKVQV